MLIQAPVTTLGCSRLTILWAEFEATISSYLESLSLKTHYSPKLCETNSKHLIFVKTKTCSPNMNLKTQPLYWNIQKINLWINRQGKHNNRQTWKWLKTTSKSCRYSGRPSDKKANFHCITKKKNISMHRKENSQPSLRHNDVCAG